MSNEKKRESKSYLTRRTAFDYVDMAVLTLLGVIMLLPMLQVVAKAFSGEGPVIAGKVTFWPVDFQIKTIDYVIKQGAFLKSFRTSVIATIAGTTLSMFLTITCAYPLSKPQLVGRKFFLYIFVFIMLFHAGMVPNYLLFRALGFTNTIWALIFSGAFSVFNMFIVKNYFESLPESVEEAARIDGASNIVTMVRIVIPMSTPVIATVLLYYAVGFWNNYMAGILYITKSDIKPLQQYLYDLVKQALETNDAAGNIKDIDASMNLSSESVRAATIVVSTVPILVVYPFLQKYFVKGMTIGSVKG